jgi:hypothetical protein
VLCRIQSRHHAGAGRAADSRGGDGPVKDHTLAREPVQIRCWNGPAVIQRQEIATQLVAENDDDITQGLMSAHGNGFTQWMTLLLQMFSDYLPNDRAKLFSVNAARVYNLDSLS